MHCILIYIIKWALCLAVLYVPFALLMRKETFLTFNRALLLCTLLGSMLLPFIKIEIPIKVEQLALESVIERHNSIIPANEGSLKVEDTEITLWHILFAIYISGAIVVATRTLINIIRIRHIINRGTLWREECESYTLHCHVSKITPFSWFNDIVISQSDYNNCKEIILHEEGHIRGGHSWDILLVSLLIPLQWFNPFIYMLTNDLKDIHEYEADRYVLQRNSDPQAYQMLILRKAIGEERYALVNNFGSNGVRKRVEMMIRQRSGCNKLLKGLYIIPATMVAVMIFAKPLYIYSNKSEAAPIAIIINEQTINDTVKTKTAPPLPSISKQQKRNENKIEREKIEKIANVSIEENRQASTTQEPRAEIKEEKQIIYKRYSENIVTEKPIVDTPCDKYKCAVIMEFEIDTEGTISDCVAKGCNVSIEEYRGDDRLATISQLRERAIEIATQFIAENKIKFIVNEDNTLTHYTANLTLSNEKLENAPTGKVLWIGTTPLKFK